MVIIQYILTTVKHPCRMRQSCTENLNAFRGVFKMLSNENISMREINNNSILNERQVHQKTPKGLHNYRVREWINLTIVSLYSYFIKQLSCRIAWSMHAGCFKSRLSESVKKLSPGGFYAFRKSRNIPRVWITQSCTENRSVFLRVFLYSCTLFWNNINFMRPLVIPSFS